MVWLTALWGCSSTQLDPSMLPARAPAVVLLATASTTEVDVSGTVLTEQTVDLDTPDDARDGFRYQIEDAAGDVIYERTTNGPMVVQSFLGYWSGVAGFDVLRALPLLGRFPLHVPLLDNGVRVRFQLRDVTGTYLDAGSYDLSRVASDDEGVLPAVSGFETLHQSGPSENRLDIAILGDGFRADEMDVFREKADVLAAALLQKPPFADYADVLNIHRIDSPSVESGASFDSATASARDTVFGSLFAVEAINRLTGANYNSVAVFQAKQWEVAQAASIVPWDTAIVLVNTSRFGGMAVHVASVTSDRPRFEDTAIHELGHSLGLLGDEYVADACIRDARRGLPVNISASPTELPWQHWVDAGTPLPTPDTPGNRDTVGAFEGAYNCATLYRPESTCEMATGDTFCAVCSEQLVRRFFRFADPVESIEQEGGSAVAVGERTDVEVRWSRDGEVFATSRPGESVRTGRSPFEVEAFVDAPEVIVGLEDLSQRYRFIAK